MVEWLKKVEKAERRKWQKVEKENDQTYNCTSVHYLNAEYCLQYTNGKNKSANQWSIF
jgi:hypothetical protein